MAHERFHIKSLAQLRETAKRLSVEIPVQENTDILLKPLTIGKGKYTLKNRFAIHPMEGFDSDKVGTPGDLTFRRYSRYAAGGAGTIWFEATAVVPEGRSNPGQLHINRDNMHVFKSLVDNTRKTARNSFGESHSPLLILQLTHSG